MIQNYFTFKFLWPYWILNSKHGKVKNSNKISKLNIKVESKSHQKKFLTLFQVVWIIQMRNEIMLLVK